MLKGSNMDYLHSADASFKVFYKEIHEIKVKQSRPQQGILMHLNWLAALSFKKSNGGKR